MITIPTISELYLASLSDLESEMNVNLPLLGKNFLRVLAAVQAVKLKLYYLKIGNLQKNIAPDTAETENIGGTLERFGRIKLGRNPFPAQAAQYELTVTGSIGAEIKRGTTFKSDDTSTNPGFLFILDNAYTLVSETDTITVRALAPGVESKLNELDRLTATAPIALVNSSAYVSGEVVEPLAAETLDAYRAATLNSYRLEAMGGAVTDFRLWAQDAQGVKLVYPYAKSNQSAVVDLFVEATTADSTDGKGTPSAQLLLDVEEVIEFNPDETLPLYERGRRPMGIFEVNYLPVTIKEIDITITGYQGLNSAIEALLLSAITDAINNMRPFVSAADILSNKNDILDTNKLIGMIINAQPGAVFTSIEMQVDSNVLSTYTFLQGNIPHLNSITYD